MHESKMSLPPSGNVQCNSAVGGGERLLHHGAEQLFLALNSGASSSAGGRCSSYGSWHIT
jgi:hypothetical protein